MLRKCLRPSEIFAHEASGALAKFRAARPAPRAPPSMNSMQPRSAWFLNTQAADQSYSLPRWRTDSVPGCTARRISSRYVAVESIRVPVPRVNVKVPGLLFSM